MKKNIFRHWCEQSDGLEKYGWLQHDGGNFGVQQIIDGSHIIDTSFVKRLGGSHGGDWTARISVDLKVIDFCFVFWLYGRLCFFSLASRIIVT
jgi:hypothetical protein